MGLFSSLFNKVKEADKKNSQTKDGNNDSIMPKASASFHKKGVADVNGLYPADLIVLALAPTIKTSDKRPTGYVYEKYEISNPGKILTQLHDKGYIVEASSKNSLSFFKVADLKSLANEIGITVKGKKADIIATLQNVDEDILSPHVADRYWVRTENGEAELKANPYIEFFLDKHEYNLEYVNVDIWSVNKEFAKNPKRPYRDIVFKQLNNNMNKFQLEYAKDPKKGTFLLQQYCNCLECMGLFVEEEKSYINASDYYFQYINNKINVYAAADFLYTWQVVFNGKPYDKNMWYEEFWRNAQIQPYEKTAILRLIEERGVEEDGVKEALITSFKRAGDHTAMSEEETAEFVVLHLTGEDDMAHEMAINAAKRMTKRIKTEISNLKRSRK